MNHPIPPSIKSRQQSNWCFTSDILRNKKKREACCLEPVNGRIAPLLRRILSGMKAICSNSCACSYLLLSSVPPLSWAEMQPPDLATSCSRQARLLKIVLARQLASDSFFHPCLFTSTISKVAPHQRHLRPLAPLLSKAKV